MTGIFRRLGPAAGVAALLWATSAFTAGATVSGDVMVARDQTTGTGVMFSAIDGSQFAPSACGGDLTHQPHGTAPRQFLYVHQAATGRSELFAADEDCGNAAQLTDSVTQTISGNPSWSVSDGRVAWAATDDVTGTTSLWVADVTRDGSGRTVGLTSNRAVAPVPRATAVRWANDGHRVTYGSGSEVYVLDVDTGQVVDVTNTPATAEMTPTFSPVANEVAFVKQTSKGGVVRNDVFAVDLSTGKQAQLTNKANAPAAQIANPDYSPDGSAIVFQGYEKSVTAGGDIYRLTLRGTAKALNLTSNIGDSILVPQWRH